MPRPIVLASSSAIRSQLLSQARVDHETFPVRIDEESIRASMTAEGAPPRDIADKLAELKAIKAGRSSPDSVVIGVDQVLELDGQLYSKPVNRADAIAQLSKFRGQRHKLFSAAVVVVSGEVVWRHIGMVQIQIRNVSDAYLQDYVDRNWDEIRYCVGCYQIEGEGVRLMSQVSGDYFSVLGLPLLELLGYLAFREDIAG
ncbi:Maf family protein [Aestuariibius insulae]|uniref:Maf family protein n=1 Tax=Aestuariibius insulae TaxID=2058287 RepID=UPI00345E9A3B